MGKLTQIEWTDGTWNPITGCDEVSPGCDHCYARGLARRLHGMGNPSYINGFEVTTHPRMLELPLRWSVPSEIFAVSMGDPFHGKVPVAFLEHVFWVMRAAGWHFFQCLTKRAARMARLAPHLWAGEPAPNVGLGVTVDTVREGKPRIEHLRRTPAAFRFVSVEPLLEDLGQLDLDGIDWVILGGESGQKARPMSPRWARNVRDQCERAGVPLCFKQWGSWLPLSQAPLQPGAELDRKIKRGRVAEVDGLQFVFVGKALSGRELDGLKHDARPLASCGATVAAYPGRPEAQRLRVELARRLSTERQPEECVTP